MKKPSSPMLIMAVITTFAVILALALGFMVIDSEGFLERGNNTCQYNGAMYKTGNNFPAGDSCNQCVCANGEVLCTELMCDQVIDDGAVQGIIDSLERQERSRR